MCLLVVFHRLRPDLPVIVAANRHEAIDRPSAPPQLHRGAPRWLGPTDLRAGGTWIGVNESGLVAAITNRDRAPFDPTRPSRGALCLDALRQSSVGGAARTICDRVGDARYNAFQLLLVDREAALVLTNEPGCASVVSRSLEPGVHVLTSRHPIDGWPPEGITALQAEIEHAPGDAVFEVLEPFCRQHAMSGEPPFAPCLHGERHGTRSSSLLTVPATGSIRMAHADDAPCRTRYREVSPL